MYSRFNDPSKSRPPRPSAGTPPRTPPRTPSYRQKVRVPPGYKGNAIVDGEERTPGVIPTYDTPDRTLPDNRDFGQAPAEPHFEELDYVSDLPNRDARPLPVPVTEALPAGRSGGLFDLSHFPFGHGLGTEEWLLIGLIFLLLREAGPERGDLDETVLLLGLLLLGG